MFKALRRLHGQNLESKGLNDMSEAFQSFVTRARFFSVGKLRRTWSHSAAEFVKYRRLLPMLMADGQDFDGGETDGQFIVSLHFFCLLEISIMLLTAPGFSSYVYYFDAALAFHARSKEDRKIIVTNISSRVTSPQLHSFFSKFGKVSHCSLPREDRRQTMFGTMPRHFKNCGTAVVTFK
ncbi:unnamed protein product [Cylicostephanus goldi]|uniref:RRM domain-containing protein n=1 Tax=Cylicostephanus goldi TaxID=71465 RepID=A0A3P6TDP1_CYLGO|nr:unnamed protein product [Cylicostephanus goldi]